MGRKRKTSSESEDDDDPILAKLKSNISKPLRKYIAGKCLLAKTLRTF